MSPVELVPLPDANLPGSVSPCPCSSACPPGGPAALKVGPGSVSGEGVMVGSTRDLSGPHCHVSLRQADSEGDLCPARSPTLTGSTSTLASSVIEVDLDRAGPELAQRPNQELVLNGC